MHQDATSHGGRSLPRGLYVVDGDPAPTPQKGYRAPKFSAHLYCVQAAGWIKMALGMEMGLGPGHIVLDGDSSSHPPKGGGAPFPVFGSVPMWPHGWMHQDATCHGGRPQPGDFVLHGDPAPLHKRGWSPQFPAHVYFDQTTGLIKIALRMDVVLSPVDFVLDGDRARSSPKKGSGSPPQFSANSTVAKRLDASRCHLVWR